MGAHGDTAAHMGHDEAQGVIGETVFGGVALGNGLLVEGVEEGTAGEVRTAGELGQVGHFVNDRGVYHIGGLTQLLANFRSQDATQVAYMGAVGATAQILQHLFVDGIGAAQKGPHQATPAHNGVKFL